MSTEGKNSGSEKRGGQPAYKCMYPEAVTLPRAYMIFNLAFDHAVLWNHLRDKQYRDQFCSALKGEWEIHPGICAEKGGGKRRQHGWQFEPQTILADSARKALLGTNRQAGKLDETGNLDEFVRRRLDPDEDSQYSEPLLFTFNNKTWIDQPFELLVASQSGEGKSEKLPPFEIKWIDLWFFPDGSGMLSFKVLLSDETTVPPNKDSFKHLHPIEWITTLIRSLRDFRDTRTLVVQPKDEESLKNRESKKKLPGFWPKLFREVLGFRRDDGHSDLLMSHLLFDRPCYAQEKRKPVDPLDYVDRYSRYCKVLIAAQTSEFSDDKEALRLKWSEPINDLPHDTVAIANGSAADKVLYQSALIAGYATPKDLLPFELATVSNHGVSVGWKEGKGWEYNREYIRSLMEHNLVEVWEYWSALALRDTIAFVSYSPDVPIMRQAEGRYYPLYVFCYHQRYQLDKLSDEIVDYGMSNVWKGRRLRDKFQRFRNHYWFQEVTRDFVGVEVFNRMKIGMCTQELYDAVSREIDEVSQHLQQKWEISVKWWGAVLAIFVWPSKTLWDEFLYPKVLPQIKEWAPSHWQPLLVGILAFVAISLLLYRFVQKKKEVFLPAWMKWSERLIFRPFRRLVLFFSGGAG